MKKIKTISCQLTAVLCLFVSLAAQAEPSPSPAGKPQRGEILRLEKDHITALPWLPPKDNQPDEPVTYVLGNQTQIYVYQKFGGEAVTRAGNRLRRSKAVLGNRDDLKVGQQVQIEAEDGTATSIAIIVDNAKSQ